MIFKAMKKQLVVLVLLKMKKKNRMIIKMLKFNWSRVKLVIKKITKLFFL